jgi:hypothetical protein
VARRHVERHAARARQPDDLAVKMPPLGRDLGRALGAGAVEEGREQHRAWRHPNLARQSIKIGELQVRVG